MLTENDQKRLFELAKRYSEEEDGHTRLEVQIELRQLLDVTTEGEIIGAVLLSLRSEHERANSEAARAERWLTMYRDAKKPKNWRGDKRHLKN